MAKIFLDANALINLIEKQVLLQTDDLIGNELFISTLTIHILIYVTKQKVPQSKLTEIVNLYSLVDFSKKISHKAFIGPTSDFEDNIQLHSAAHADCDYFLTQDNQLLTLKFFGKTQITSTLNTSFS